MASAERIVLTCEHGGNLIPSPYSHLFAGKRRLLDSHRGFDPGALDLAGRLAADLRAPLTFALVSRLLVDLNRSLDNADLFSTITRDLSASVRRQILAAHYTPYRSHITRQIRSLVGRSTPVLHLSVHSFTPVLRGRRRTADIGILFDPSRPREVAAAARLRRAFKHTRPDLIVRNNYPYLGTDDGFTTHLRTLFPDRLYAGIELEINQRFPRASSTSWNRFVDHFSAAAKLAWAPGEPA